MSLRARINRLRRQDIVFSDEEIEAALEDELLRRGAVTPEQRDKALADIEEELREEARGT